MQREFLTNKVIDPDNNQRFIGTYYRDVSLQIVRQVYDKSSALIFSRNQTSVP